MLSSHVLGTLECSERAGGWVLEIEHLGTQYLSTNNVHAVQLVICLRYLVMDLGHFTVVGKIFICNVLIIL